jgi:two-component system response regulator YesN
MKPTILIIDDEAALLESLRNLLSSDYNVLCAERGRKGLTILKKDKVDLVLLDYRLPDINGIKVLKGIKGVHTDMPVIMMSGYCDKALVISAWDEKADGYLDKPLDIDVLQEKLVEFIGRRGNPILNIDLSNLSATVRSIINALDENPHRFQSVRNIADSFSLNPDYLSHLFKKETGVNLYEYMARLKVAKARELLRDKRHSVKEISYNLGFISPTAFYKIFKRFNGLSPEEFRQHLFPI